MRHLVKSLLPNGVRRYLRPWIQQRRIRRGYPSFAQEGEDRILFRHFEHRMDRPGFYVDVGAHHPRRFSNTYLFYLRGWRGINIEPNGALARMFFTDRPRDTTLVCGVGPEAGQMTYYVFGDPALNTFDAEQVRWLETTSAYRLVGTQAVAVRPLAEILAEHVSPGQTIDFMSVDVEGFDLAVLRSNDWARFRPEFLLVEILGLSLTQAASGEVAGFMAEQGYDLVGKAVHTAFFRRR